MKCALDGDYRTGVYMVDCECGVSTRGDAGTDSNGRISPALPIAWVVAHMKLAHPSQQTDVRFARGYVEWLNHYWQIHLLQEELFAF